jgi:hypothetical protein
MRYQIAKGIELIFVQASAGTPSKTTNKTFSHAFLKAFVTELLLYRISHLLVVRYNYGGYLPQKRQGGAMAT